MRDTKAAALAATVPRCQTCKERKIKCDGRTPTCQNCQKSHRTCHFSSFALSWPAPKSRRAIVAAPTTAAGDGPGSRHATGTTGATDATRQQRHRRLYFVNVSSRHVAANAFLDRASSSGTTGQRIDLERQYGVLPVSVYPAKTLPTSLPSSLFANVNRLEIGGTSLMSYFYNETTKTLPQIDNEPSELRDLLLRMSASDDTPSSRAVLSAMFCLSSVHRDGNQQQAMYFKHLALRSLQEAARMDLHLRDGAHILQHAATALLLCRAEVAAGDDASTFWGLYVCSLRTILEQSLPDKRMHYALMSREAYVLYRYILYHDVLSRFSLFHWKNLDAITGQLHSDFHGHALEFRCKSPLDLPRDESHDLQQEFLLLVRILTFSKEERGTSPKAIARHERTRNQLADELTTRLDESRADCDKAAAATQESAVDVAAASMAAQRYLFVAACWIYFQRACMQLSGESDAIAALLDSVFSLVDFVQRLGLRVAPVSLFVIGSELASDSRRRTILDLCQQHEPSTSGSAAPRVGVVHLLETAWTLDDLHDSSRGYLDYSAKMEWVMTSKDVLPALV